MNARGSDGYREHCGIGNGWLAVEMAANDSLMLGVAYWDDGVGSVPDNVARLTDMAALAKSRGKYLVAGGDWNFTPEQMHASGLLEGLELDTVVPSDLDATCTGGQGRMLD